MPLVAIARRIVPDGAGKPISVPTLKRAFRHELSEAYEETKASMISSILQAARAGQWGAARYWLATHGGPEWRWTDPDAPLMRVGLSSSGTDLNRLSDDEVRRQLAELERKIAIEGQLAGEEISFVPPVPAKVH